MAVQSPSGIVILMVSVSGSPTSERVKYPLTVTSWAGINSGISLHPENV